MTITLTPEQQKMIEDRLKSGKFRSAGEVISEALQALEQRELAAPQVRDKRKQREAVESMIEFIKKNRVRLDGVTVKELIHEGHRW